MIGLNKTSLFFSKEYYEKELLQTFDTHSHKHTKSRYIRIPLISLLIYLCCGKSLFFFLFLSLTFLLFQKLFGHSSIFYIYKTSTFPPCPNMHEEKWNNSIVGTILQTCTFPPCPNIHAENLKLKTENWKHCSKIIFKCINSIVGPIFNIF